MPKFTKQCCWCNSTYEFERSSKRTCSAACSTAFRRWAESLNINNTIGFAYLEAIKLFNGQHPNKKYGECA